MSCFINLSNHPSSKWSDKQLAQALCYGEVVDIPFPEIDPHCDSEHIDRLVQEYFERIELYDSPTVMVQGEFLFTYRMVVKLKENGIKAIASCSNRRTVEYVDSEGRTNKKSKFEFVGFKEY